MAFRGFIEQAKFGIAIFDRHCLSGGKNANGFSGGNPLNIVAGIPQKLAEPPSEPLYRHHTRAFPFRSTFGLCQYFDRPGLQIVVGGVKRQLAFLYKGGKQRGGSAH